MNDGHFDCSPVDNDTDNSENLLPEKGLCVSPGKFSSKGDSRLGLKNGTERVALTSLQLNSDCGSETLKTSGSLEVPPDPKNSAPSTVHRSDLSTTSVQKSDIQDKSSASEDYSLAATHATDNTWETCNDGVPSLTPSPSHPGQSTTQSSASEHLDTAEDTSNCSFEDLSSSKEVSFNLPPGYSEWLKTNTDCQPAVPPTNSVQSLSHIVTTVIENNPEIYPSNSNESVEVVPPEAIPEVLFQPSVATQILQRSGVTKEVEDDPGLSDSFSELLCKFSSLNVEDKDGPEELQSENVTNDFSAFESEPVNETVNVSFSDSSKQVEPASTPSLTDCDSISEAEYLPASDIPEDPLPVSVSPTELVLSPQRISVEDTQFAGVLEDTSLVTTSPVLSSPQRVSLEDSRLAEGVLEDTSLVTTSPALSSPQRVSLEDSQLAEGVLEDTSLVTTSPVLSSPQRVSLEDSQLAEGVLEDTALVTASLSAPQHNSEEDNQPETGVSQDPLLVPASPTPALETPPRHISAEDNQLETVALDLSSTSASLTQPVSASECSSLEDNHILALVPEEPSSGPNSTQLFSETQHSLEPVADILVNDQQCDPVLSDLSAVDAHSDENELEVKPTSAEFEPEVNCTNSSVQEQPDSCSSVERLSVDLPSAVSPNPDQEADPSSSQPDFEQPLVEETEKEYCTGDLVTADSQEQTREVDSIQSESPTDEHTQVNQEFPLTNDQSYTEDITNTRDVVDADVLDTVNKDNVDTVFEPAVLPVDTAVEVEESTRFTTDDLNTTDNLFLEFNLNVNDKLDFQTPLKSLLDVTVTEDAENRISASASSAETPEILPGSLERVVLEAVPAKTLQVLKDRCTVPDTCNLPNNFDANTSNLAAKEDNVVNSLDNLPDVDTSEFERLIGEDCVAMPMHMMEAQIDHQWHQNEQMNTIVGDNNCDVDVNVNQCCNMQGNNYHNVEANMKMVNSDVDSVTSSPNKRKNDEDSAFEDLATVEDANSDLVDDHIMDDQVEEIGVASVSRRSPSQTRTRDFSPKPKTGSTNDGNFVVSDPPAINHSEAGPVVAEFTEDELRAAAEVFKDPSTFEFLERVSSSKAFEESSLSRLSLYVKFDPLVAKKSQENQSRGTFKKPVAPQKKSDPVGQEAPSKGEELFTLGNNSSPAVHRREVDAQKLIDFHSPNPPQSVAKANPKMVPVEPVQRIENMPCKVFTEDDMKKAMKINELMFNERVIKKEKELAETESKYQAQMDAEKERNSVLQESLTFTRRLLEESGQIMRQWQEKKELERVEVTRERDQALEDLRSVEASFSELHRRYEKIKAVLEGYKQNEEGLRVQLLDTQDKLKKQDQMYDALKQHTKEKLDSANSEIENARKAGGSEIAVLRSQLMKAEMKVNSLEKSLEHKAQEYIQLTAIYDDLVARVSGSQ